TSSCRPMRRSGNPGSSHDVKPALHVSLTSSPSETATVGKIDAQFSTHVENIDRHGSQPGDIERKCRIGDGQTAGTKQCPFVAIADCKMSIDGQRHGH